MMDDLTQALAFWDTPKPWDQLNETQTIEPLKPIMDAARRWDWLTILCTNCAGKGQKMVYSPIAALDKWGKCPVCGGRGWTINPEATELVAGATLDRMDKHEHTDKEWRMAMELAEAGLIVLVETAGDNQ